MSKYEPLSRFLGSHPGMRVRLDFSAIERILGFKLPKSAREYEAWWSNNETGHSHARAWIANGWRTENVDVAGRGVTFVRIAGRTGTAASGDGPDPWGCMAGTITVLHGADMTKPSELWNAEKGLLLNE